MANNQPNQYSPERERIYAWFFQETNHQWVNFKKFYKGANKYQQYATWINILTGIIGTILVLTILAFIQGFREDFVLPATMGTALLIGVISVVDVVGRFDRRHVRYYRTGQRMDDLYTDMEYVLTIRLPDPDENDNELRRVCKDLVDRKDDLNGSAPQVPSKFYHELKREHAEKQEGDGNPLKWDRPNLEDLRNDPSLVDQT